MKTGALMLTSGRSTPRGPGIAYTVLAGIMALMVGVLALNANQAPPPQIAEFAPQSIEQIKKAPNEQGSDFGLFGSGNGAQDQGLAGGGSILASPTPPPVDVPRLRRCYKQSDGRQTQTEDPQSPPCVAYFDPNKSDNGGATSFGVTRDEITVAWPGTIEKARDTQDLVTFFNSRFEFYGRKIVLQPYGPQGGVFGPVDASTMQSDADYVYQQFAPFASLAYIPKAGVDHYYYDRLAREPHGIVSINSHATSDMEQHFQQFSPYEWSYLPSYDLLMRNYAEFICKSLAGRPPSHAGVGISGNTTPRVFGIVKMIVADNSSPDSAVLRSALNDGCGVRPAVDVAMSDPKDVISKFKIAGVTTVICLCQAGHYFNDLMPEATNEVFFPEWLVSSFHYLDYDSAGQKYPNEHADHIFGITFHNKWLPQKDMLWYQAIKEVDPEYETGDDGFSSTSYERYYELLALSSGIQMAGPHLTPETFAQGMTKAGFPASGSGNDPLYYPGGGFSANDHSMVDDASMIWWSKNDEGYTTNVRVGTFCYVDHGKRYGLGQWPSGDQPFFQGSCK
ncbi:MAG: hypothetical protein ABR507_02375 [Actinomycetota bacterium]|nr:hypothetical protein [Actinomycetota bacterium]